MMTITGSPMRISSFNFMTLTPGLNCKERIPEPESPLLMTISQVKSLSKKPRESKSWLVEKMTLYVM